MQLTVKTKEAIEGVKDDAKVFRSLSEDSNMHNAVGIEHPYGAKGT